MGGKIVFTLDARIDLTAEEAALIKKYGLGKEVIYNSEKSKRHLESTRNALATTGGGALLKAGVSLAMAKLSLNFTVDSLVRGHHIECKDLEELLAAEETLMEACRNIKLYLDTAVTFDGREVVIDFDEAVPAV